VERKKEKKAAHLQNFLSYLRGLAGRIITREGKKKKKRKGKK